MASEYDAVRPGYPSELVAAVVAFASSSPIRAVEVGAGTGLATDSFATLGLSITCVEPDPEMAEILARRFAGNDSIDVVIGRFEDWMPPAGGVDLLYCAQAWHWVSPSTRLQLAANALVPGGVIALFGHGYNFVDATVEAELDAVYRRIAPVLLADPAKPPRPTASALTELADSPLFESVRVADFSRIVPYATHDYLRLLTTFSPHRMLAPDTLQALLAGIAAVIDAHGGVLEQRLDTRLALARSAFPA